MSSDEREELAFYREQYPRLQAQLIEHLTQEQARVEDWKRRLGEIIEAAQREHLRCLALEKRLSCPSPR